MAQPWYRLYGTWVLSWMMLWTTSFCCEGFMYGNLPFSTEHRIHTTSRSGSIHDDPKSFWQLLAVSDDKEGDNYNHHNHKNFVMLVVGKIIVDEYGPPEELQPNITVGGGGPQAAMGAALGLAARGLLLEKKQHDKNLPPPKQPILFCGPVGDLDFSSPEEDALCDMLLPALQFPPRFLRGKDWITPRIRLWHDSDQILQWYALQDSFGDQGAGGLWAHVPSTQDYLEMVDQLLLSNMDRQKPRMILHMIAEGGAEAPGDNGDARPLWDSQLREKLDFVGVEPILFPNEEGHVSEKDARYCSKILQQILDATTTEEGGEGKSLQQQPSVVFSPDMAAYQGMAQADCLPQSDVLDSWAIRDGPKGSHLLVGQGETTTESTRTTIIPAATLRQLVNPTGAGNAYSAAYTALRGSGCDALLASCLATGVGAVFCEYAHCPPYTWDVIERVAQASQEVKQQVVVDNDDEPLAVLQEQQGVSS